jgi:hypothetical protein
MPQQPEIKIIVPPPLKFSKIQLLSPNVSPLRTTPKDIQQSFNPFDAAIQQQQLTVVTHDNNTSGETTTSPRVATPLTPMLLRSTRTPGSPVSEGTVLCDDTICHILSFLPYDSVLKFRSVNSTGCHIASTFDYYWNTESKRIMDLEEIPRSANNFLEFVQICKTSKHKRYWDMLAIKKVRRLDPLYKAMRILYGGISPFLFSIGFVLVSVLIPLFLDGLITSSLGIAMSFIPVVLLTVLPYLVMTAGLTLFSCVYQPWRQSVYDGLSPKRKHKLQTYFFDRDHIEDLTARHASVICIWQFLGLPLNVVLVFLKYLTGSEKLIPFCTPQFIFTLFYITLPVLCYISAKKSMVYDGKQATRKVLSTIACVHLHGILFNIMLSVQIGFIAAKLDNLIVWPWYPVFVPFWIYCLVEFTSVIVYSILLFTKKEMRTSVHTLLLLAFGLLSLVVVAVGIALIIVALRLHGVLQLAYFIASIPLLFGSMILIPISLLTGLVCCYFSLHKVPTKK